MRLNEHAQSAREWHDAIWQSPVALDYLHGRGLVDASISAWRIGYCDDEFNYMGGRVTFPIMDFCGNVISIAGRGVTPDIVPRYWSYSGWPKARYLFGLHLVRPCPYVVICEGQMDAIMLRQAGYQALAVMGSSLSPVAASLLRLWTTAAVVYPDNVVPDEKAFEKALKWIPVLESVGVTAVFPRRPYENAACADPADLIQSNPRWLHHQIEAAVDGLTGRDDSTYVLDIENIGG